MKASPEFGETACAADGLPNDPNGAAEEANHDKSCSCAVATTPGCLILAESEPG